MRGVWDQVDGDFRLEIKENDFDATIVLAADNNGYESSVIVSIEPVGMSEYLFNVVNSLKSGIDEQNELNKTFRLYEDFSYTDSYIFDVSDLYRDILRMKLSDSDSYYEFKRVNN